MTDWRDGFQCKALNAKGEPCGSKFRSTINPEFCSRHDPDMAEFWAATSQTGGENRVRKRSTCFLDGCSKPLPKGRAKWCSDEHSTLGTQRAQSERKRLKSGQKPVATQTRRPRDEFFAEGWHLMVDGAGNPSTDVIRDCAAFFDIDKTTVVRWYAWCRQQTWDTRGGEEWAPPPRDFPDSHFDLTVADIPALVADFLRFRVKYFVTPQGEKYETPEFQQVWLAALLQTLVSGGRQVILSPPRHGKTELLIHVSAWLICRFPRIRILWIGGNEAIAKRSVRLVMRSLVNNKKLIGDYCPPGVGFKPSGGSGLTWSADEFYIAAREGDDMKGATMTALGRGGTVLSLDADIIVVDDPEDHRSTVQPGSREGTRDWFTSDIESRKEEHTGLFVIGSRVHVDDLVGHLIENDEYSAITETAHDPNCEIPQEDQSRWAEHVDCMLFPALRTFRWLMQQKRASEGSGGIARYNMVYLGKVSGKGMTIFIASEIAACRSRSYRAGLMPKPIIPDGYDPGEEGMPGISLVGGLDPSGSGYQASFLWAYQVKPELRMWMVDIENHEGGGIAQARRIISAWHETYRLSHWVVEENLYHGGISEDEMLMEIRTRLGIVVEPHHTGVNKWDSNLGVSTLQPLFAEQQIVLPYGDEESVAKSDAYQRQLVHFSDAPRNRNTRAGTKSDLVMASWFPMVVIRRMRMEYVADVGVEYEQSYGGYGRSDWNEAPWGKKKSMAVA